MTTECAVRTESLSKHYGSFCALDSCSVDVPRQGIFGLLGPNGAGKSTLIRLLLGMLRPTAGGGSVMTHCIRRDNLAVKRCVSYLPGDARLYRQMRGRDVLGMFAELHPLGDLALGRDLAKQFDLDLSRRVAFMSTGMRQKLALSITLGSRAPLLILDEPTANLDPDVRRHVLDVIRGCRRDGQAIILSSHLFTDVDGVCDRVGILCKGKLVATHELAACPAMHIAHISCPDSQAGALADALDANAALSTGAIVQSQRRDALDDNTQRFRIVLSGPAADWLGWINKLLVDYRLHDLTLHHCGVEGLYDTAVADFSSQPTTDVEHDV